MYQPSLQVYTSRGGGGTKCCKVAGTGRFRVSQHSQTPHRACRKFFYVTCINKALQSPPPFPLDHTKKASAAPPLVADPLVHLSRRPRGERRRRGGSASMCSVRLCGRGLGVAGLASAETGGCLCIRTAARAAAHARTQPPRQLLEPGCSSHPIDPIQTGAITIFWMP